MIRPRSLATRVVLGVALGSLLAGTIVTLVTGVLANRLARDQEDQHLLDAARTLAFELQVKGYDPNYAVRDEMHELAHTGIVVTVFENGRYLAGIPEIPFVSPDTCVNAARSRVCAVPAGRWVTAAARDQGLTRSHVEVTTLAACVALVLMILFSTGMALVLARAAVQPLDQLAAAVRAMPATGLAAADVGAEAGVQEVDALRFSLQTVFDELQQALAHSRSFAGDAAHQLRTPLATITGELDLALEIEGERGRPEMIHARHVAARLSRLVDRLLVLASPDEVMSWSTTVSLLDVLEDALETLPETARERVDYQGAVVMLKADPPLLLTGIVSALEHTLESSAGRVRVDVLLRENRAVLAIEADWPSGASLSREELPWLFDVDQARRAGHGIELAVTARVASLHDGSARFSEHTPRARLELSFPRVDE